LSPPKPKPPEPKPPLARAVRDSASYTARALGLVWRSSKGLTVALASLTLVGAMVPPAIAWAGKHIVDSVVARSHDLTLTWVLVELGLVVLQATVSRGSTLVRSILGSRLGSDVNIAILERATRLELRHFEDPEFYDQLSRARREASSRPVSLISESFGLVQSVLTLLGYAALLVAFSPWAVLVLMIATVPATLAEMRYSKVAFRLRNWRSQESRRLMYLEYVLANDEHAKEVKLFGLGPLFLGRYKDLAERFHREDSRLAVRRAIVTHVLALIATAAFYGAYVIMALLAAAGKLTLGELTLYVLAFRSGQQSFQGILNGIGTIYEHNLYMSNLFSFLDRAPGPEAPALPARTSSNGANGSGVELTSAPNERGIRLEGVSFRYPGKEGFVLENVDLFIPRGQSVALVGQNGAGKTTFVKLVTGLYRPSAGRILLDGKPLDDHEDDELRRRFGIVFQDFNQYQLLLRENVGVGSVGHLDDTARIGEAIQRGGAEPLVKSLEQGIDSPLGRWFSDGVELSGGQWQSVALSRGFMRESADILVLDEPTAALDAEAEHAVFERFRRLAAGRTTIIISHRFPTVRMADRILLLENGRIAEDGTHDELLRRDETYARLYRLQASGYE
jgi:ATP-binding cassette subfamily B protein